VARRRRRGPVVRLRSRAPVRRWTEPRHHDQRHARRGGGGPGDRRCLVRGQRPGLRACPDDHDGRRLRRHVDAPRCSRRRPGRLGLRGRHGRRGRAGGRRVDPPRHPRGRRCQRVRRSARAVTGPLVRTPAWSRARRALGAACVCARGGRSRSAGRRPGGHGPTAPGGGVGAPAGVTRRAARGRGSGGRAADRHGSGAPRDPGPGPRRAAQTVDRSASRARTQACPPHADLAFHGRGGAAGRDAGSAWAARAPPTSGASRARPYAASARDRSGASVRLAADRAARRGAARGPRHGRARWAHGAAKGHTYNGRRCAST
jgi:hypothetical protein